MDEFLAKLFKLNENFQIMEKSIRQTLNRMNEALNEMMDLCRDQSTLALSHPSPIHSSTPINEDNNENGDATFFEPAEQAEALVLVTNSTINEPKDRVKKNLTFEAAASKPAVPVSEFAPALSIPAALAVLKPAAVAVSKPTAVAVSKPAAVAVSEPAACAVSKPVPSCYKEVKAIQRARLEGKTLRGKLRKHMPAHSCSSCAKYYAAANLDMNDIQKCSRHRAWTARPKTPEKFWYPGWISPDKNDNEDREPEEKKPEKPDMTQCRQM